MLGARATFRRRRSTLAISSEEKKKNANPRTPAIASIVLGVLLALTGGGNLYENPAPLLIGLVSIGLGVWALSKERRRPAVWGAIIAGLALLGYIGNLAQPS
jgi:hypothetical protein